ncbi:MAG TPA: YpdA family putative bacillithiol disulfide reductase [Vicinamibacteria bacterium]|nr:YpdA family putative bacillithiol disulfide reductase [Vicinamibacteria bacterium]
MLDLIVVGAGPSGLAAAIAALRAGLDYQVLEKGMLVEAVFRFPRGMTFFTTADLLEIGDLPFTTPHPKPTREEALNYYRRVVDTYDLRIALAEQVTDIRREADGSFAVQSLAERAGGPPRPQARRSRFVAVATGYYDHPNRLGVPGEDLPHVAHYFDEPHPFHRRRVVVVGGANSAAEAALALYRTGAQVTLVHRRGELSSHIKYWVKPDVENRIREGSIAARLDSRLLEIRPDHVLVEGPQGREEIPADAVFLLTGYRPDTTLLERAGVRIDPDTLAPEHDPKTFETNVPGLYLAGAVVAGRNTNRIFIENGRFHGAQVVKAIVAREALSGAR